jgi:hypothetical protein
MESSLPLSVSSSPSPSSSYLSRAYDEVDAASTTAARTSPSSASAADFFDETKFPFINTVVLETLRLTAHSIGAMRKVMSPDGWTVEDEVRTSQGVEKVTYTVPCGSYVGVSHIVPHLDQNKSAHSLSLTALCPLSLSL